MIEGKFVEMEKVGGRTVRESRESELMVRKQVEFSNKMRKGGVE